MERDIDTYQNGSALYATMEDGVSYVIYQAEDFIDEPDMTMGFDVDVDVSDNEHCFGADDHWNAEHTRVYILTDYAISMLEDGQVLCVRGPQHGTYHARESIEEWRIAQDPGAIHMGEEYVDEEFFSTLPYIVGRIDGEGEDLTVFFCLGD